MRASILALLLALVAAPPPAMAADMPARNHDIVPEDYLDIATLTSLAASPDGTRAAWTESRWGEARENDLWLLDRRTNAPATVRRLTFDGFGGNDPTWSPDGAWIYMTGKQTRADADAPPYDGTTQVWRIAPDGGRLEPVTRAAEGVGHFVLAPNGATLYYTVGHEVTQDPWREMKETYKDLEYGSGVDHLDAVESLDLTNWRVHELAPASRSIRDLAVSPDGRHLALITTPSAATITSEGWSRVDLLDVATGDVTVLTDEGWRADHPSPYGWLDDLAWAPDSRALAFTISYDGYPTRIYVGEQVGDGWPLHEIVRHDEAHYDGGLCWRGKDRVLCWRGERDACVRVLATAGVEMGGQGRTTALTPVDVVAGPFSFSRDGQVLLASLATTKRLNDIYLCGAKGSDTMESATVLTDLNPQVATWKLPQISRITWQGGDGDPCSGILELPPGYDRKSGGPLPMILEIHGGPTASTRYRLRLWSYGRALMPANGYALLSPNYHGSTGYGDAFMEKLIGRENDIEVQDLLTGVHHLIDTGLVDPQRVGVSGWSNGGYLTNCVIVAEPTLFKAASSGAGVLDMVIQWGTEDTPGHVINFAEGLPWEVPDHYRASSPLYHLDRVQTPTLIHVGGADPRVPPAHSKALFRALHRYLGVPCELVIYPGEPHGLTKAKNRVAKMTWDLAWFKKYLAGT